MRSLSDLRPNASTTRRGPGRRRAVQAYGCFHFHAEGAYSAYVCSSPVHLKELHRSRGRVLSSWRYGRLQQQGQESSYAEMEVKTPLPMHGINTTVLVRLLNPRRQRQQPLQPQTDVLAVFYAEAVADADDDISRNSSPVQTVTTQLDSSEQFLIVKPVTAL